MRFDAPTLARLRPAIMKRGQILATLLSEVLAGKDKKRELAAIDLSTKAGLRPEERLRMALDQIESRRKLLDADDDRFGRCDVCGIDLGLVALTEYPWADRCAAHAGE
jgi:RNA polymerase-binding transcription factor DksA